MKQNYTSEIKLNEWLENVNVSSYELLELLLNTHVDLLELEGRVSGKGNVLGVFPDGGSLHLLVDWQQAPEVVEDHEEQEWRDDDFEVFDVTLHTDGEADDEGDDDEDCEEEDVQELDVEGDSDGESVVPVDSHEHKAAENGIEAPEYLENEHH